MQLALAKSAFQLSLDDRVGYLGNAKTNASTTKPGTIRTARTSVLHETSDLLDVANIQIEVLQRLKSESRLASDRKAEVVKELDGSILPLTVVSLQPSLL